jgi:23S rRNA (adenine2503-C2)-methyltransferase
VYQKSITSFYKISNISNQSIEIIDKHFEINDIDIIKCLVDQNDETTKFLFKLHDQQCVETVLMKFNYGYSICISTQVGCNMGCKFCASGLKKKIRDLSTDEIVLQYVKVSKYLQEKANKRISNIVIMGIGEPFDNYENLSNALNIFKDHLGIAVGSRHITISTCGLINKFDDFAKNFGQMNLAISLHAPNDDIRNKLMPINKKYNLQPLIKAIKQYFTQSNRKLSFEYILIAGVNDQDSHALELCKLLKGLMCYVNIILYNRVNEYDYQPSKRIKEFCCILNKHNIKHTKRLERGALINAACGQLRINYENNI